MIIVLPFCNKDALTQVKNLAWMFELDGKTQFECLLAWPDSTKPEFIEKVRAGASKVFAKVHEFTYPEATETTWPAGPNWAWQSVARWIPMITNSKGNTYPFEKVLPDGTPWLFLEADAVPLKPGWMQTLADEYRRGGKPFMGHVVKDMGHMNGVAVYPNHVAFYARDALHAVHSAWDAVLREQTIEFTHNANHLIQHCWVLRNQDTPMHFGDGPAPSFRDPGHMHRILEPNAVLFHRTKDGSLINCLMQARTTPKVIKGEPIQPYTGEVSATQVILKGDGPFPEHTGVTAVIEAEKPDEYTTEKFPKTEIFVVTYGADQGFRVTEKGERIDCRWLQYCLYSIREFASGFSGVTVVCPDRDVEVIEPVCREWGPENLTLELFTEHEGKGMLHHMAIECMADQFVPTADFILHFDSDLIFIEPVTPADYFVDGKPVLLMEAYERFKDVHPGVMRWQETTQKAIGKPVQFEFMRRHPAVHHRDIYAKTRAMVEAQHKMPFLDWAVSGQNEFPQSWSEYNVLGAVAYIRGRNKYHWINTGDDLPPKSKLWQGWSHGGLDRPSDTGQFVPETPRAIFKRILGI